MHGGFPMKANQHNLESSGVLEGKKSLLIAELCKTEILE